MLRMEGEVGFGGDGQPRRCKGSGSDDEMTRISNLEQKERIVDGPHAPDWDT